MRTIASKSRLLILAAIMTLSANAAFATDTPTPIIYFCGVSYKNGICTTKYCSGFVETMDEHGCPQPGTLEPAYGQSFIESWEDCKARMDQLFCPFF